MKRIFEQAAERFRLSEHLSGESVSDPEKVNFYEGLALLAEGLHKLERRLDQIDSEMNEPSSAVGRPKLRRRIRIPIFTVPPPP